VKKGIAFSLAFLALGCSSVPPDLNHDSSQFRGDKGGERENVGNGRGGPAKSYAGTTSETNPFVNEPDKAVVLFRLAENVSFLKPASAFVRSLRIESKDKTRGFGFEILDGKPGLYFTAMF